MLFILLISKGNPLEWTPGNVVDWLLRHDLDRLTSAFAAADIDGHCLLLGLDDSTLDALGVTAHHVREAFKRLNADLIKPKELQQSAWAEEMH